jgi:hypothetical protein
MKEVPELADGASDMSKEMTALLEQEPVFGYIQDGFKKAHEILKLRREAAEVSGLREENAKLKAENAEYVKKTTPTGGADAAKHPGPRKAEDMDLDELHRKLEREAELADMTA